MIADAPRRIGEPVTVHYSLFDEWYALEPAAMPLAVFTISLVLRLWQNMDYRRRPGAE